MRIIKIELAKVVTIHQEKIKIIKQSECTAAQTSNVQRFLERRQPPHFRAGSNTQYINGFWIYFWKTTRLSSRCSQSLFRRPRFYNPHYGAFTNLHISKNRGIGRFRFQYINRLCVLVATLEQIKPLFQTEFAIGRKLQSFQFRSINLRAAQMERAVARKAARNATDPVCFGNAAKVQSEPWERERVLKSSLSIRVPQFDLAACTAKTARINGASLGCSLSTMSWCISSFHPQLQNQDGSLGLISSRGDATTDGLGAIFNQPRRSLWTFSPQTSASCQESEAAPALYISSVVTWDSRKQLSSSAFQVSLRLRRQMCSVSGTKTAAPFQGRIEYSVYKRILDLFLENDAAVFPVQLESISPASFLQSTLRRFHKFAHFQKQRDRPFSVSVYKPTLCSCSH
ncbi:Hypothetical_protein [Hexamita inflata]|uniref:Hypothetical_protein n=1 Tax=Hexamita inflata TaxID=28002 RepID=A0AA86R0U2_9EUKA|nr:Hypothetical protein HINF_LOCUS51323 [Hexamita inflata]